MENTFYYKNMNLNIQIFMKNFRKYKKMSINVYIWFKYTIARDHKAYSTNCFLIQ